MSVLEHRTYESLAGRLIAVRHGTISLNTDLLLTDTLGSVLASMSSTAGNASLLGNQGFGPYGKQRYSKGTIPTTKGYTGQYGDALTGLDSYVARSYDAVVGRFLSADTVESNLEGMDPYAYVGGNPQTYNDPTGHCPLCVAMLLGAIAGAVGAAVGNILVQVVDGYIRGDSNPWVHLDWGNVGWAALEGAITGATFILGAALAHKLTELGKAAYAARTASRTASTDINVVVNAEINAAVSTGERFTESAIHSWVSRVGAPIIKEENLAGFDRGRLWLGSFGGKGITVNGVDYPTANSGLNQLHAWARTFGGKVYDIPNPTFAQIQAEIDSASSIFFNISRAGFRPDGWTGQEFQYIMAHPEVLRKTTFIFGATW
jgi:RHS repeat-associated protein